MGKAKIYKWLYMISRSLISSWNGSWNIVFVLWIAPAPIEVSCRTSLSSVLCVTTPFLDNENRSCYLKPYLVLFISSCLIQVHFFIPYNSSPYFVSKKCFYIFFHALRVISGFLMWLVCSHMIGSNIDVSKRQQRKWHALPLIKFQGV